MGVLLAGVLPRVKSLETFAALRGIEQNGGCLTLQNAREEFSAELQAEREAREFSDNEIASKLEVLQAPISSLCEASGDRQMSLHLLQSQDRTAAIEGRASDLDQLQSWISSEIASLRSDIQKVVADKHNACHTELKLYKGEQEKFQRDCESALRDLLEMVN